MHGLIPYKIYLKCGQTITIFSDDNFHVSYLKALLNPSDKVLTYQSTVILLDQVVAITKDEPDLRC